MVLRELVVYLISVLVTIDAPQRAAPPPIVPEVIEVILRTMAVAWLLHSARRRTRAAARARVRSTKLFIRSDHVYTAVPVAKI